MVEATLTARSIGGSETNVEGVQAPGLERHVVEMLVHDLQNPLAGIMAFLEIMKERRDGHRENR